MIPILAGLLVFGLLHSITADKTVKTYFKTRFGERTYHGFYRLIYNIIAGITLTPILIYTFTQGVPLWMYPDSLRFLLTGVQIVGIFGLIFSIAQIDGGQFMGTSQIRAYLRHQPLPLPHEPLQTTGVYALVRHPLYLFSLMVIWTIPLTDTLLAFNVGVTLYFLIGSLYEERRMLATFGHAYETYRQNVPWLIPFTHKIFKRSRTP